MTSRRKVLGGALVTVVAGGAAGAAWLTEARQPDGQGSAAAQVPTATAEVTRGTISERFQINGTFGYGTTYPIVHLGQPGVLTGITAAEIVVARGARLYAVADQAVRLLYGRLPAYRDFEAGMTDGPDVRQLETNLVALGLDPYHRLTVDGHFSAATATAIRRWQTAWGLPSAQRSGSLPLGQVVFQPGAVRIKEALATIGAMARPDQPVVTVTATTPVVTAAITADRRRLVKVGDRVTLTLTGTAPFPGTVLAITRPPAASGQSGSSDGGAESPFQATISATPPPGTGTLEQAPVLAAFTRQTHENVLTVPIVALLARPGGGYQVRLESDQYVPVEPGLFDGTAGRVEVTGALMPGQRVKVPAS
ncbi:peptidoglycan hydrolase-like protein with peptidoglycan-binding domain [Hamadaea flava]|uniref:Peptidoglycan-binding protein n=1 Tax=Hamadaea flava TaxID=1742688 RepID=A0ABV8LRG8_9ACTN|nr:peptidoglycan-binding domain-containing protein [Hamadaea flava]MCP2328720.1 peptidoglycan hydrolase-like protein with peptidoglycan-binding domain [Hamadaea flava]